ncbi:hypothetical protein ACOSQ4_020786 [Xanthoceras sorbifolium]
MLFVSCAVEGRYYWAGNGDFAMITAAFAMKINASISDAKITGEEVRLVVFQMYPTKAPRVDGMPALFNKKIWDTIGYNVTVACLKYLNEGAVLDKINHTLITLIPKVTTAQRVSNFRPISLCNIIYKSVARLSQIGFVMKCVTSVSLSFLVNGKHARFIKSSKDYAKVIPCTRMVVPISYLCDNQSVRGKSLLQKAQFQELAIVYGESGFVEIVFSILVAPSLWRISLAGRNRIFPITTW